MTDDPAILRQKMLEMLSPLIVLETMIAGDGPGQQSVLKLWINRVMNNNKDKSMPEQAKLILDGFSTSLETLMHNHLQELRRKSYFDSKDKGRDR